MCLKGKLLFICVLCYLKSLPSFSLTSLNCSEAPHVALPETRSRGCLLVMAMQTVSSGFCLAHAAGLRLLSCALMLRFSIM